MTRSCRGVGNLLEITPCVLRVVQGGAAEARKYFYPAADLRRQGSLAEEQQGESAAVHTTHLHVHPLCCHCMRGEPHPPPTTHRRAAAITALAHLRV